MATSATAAADPGGDEPGAYFDAQGRDGRSVGVPTDALIEASSACLPDDSDGLTGGYVRAVVGDGVADVAAAGSPAVWVRVRLLLYRSSEGE